MGAICHIGILLCKHSCYIVFSSLMCLYFANGTSLFLTTCSCKHCCPTVNLSDINVHYLLLCTSSGSRIFSGGQGQSTGVVLIWFACCHKMHKLFVLLKQSCTVWVEDQPHGPPGSASDVLFHPNILCII